MCNLYSMTRNRQAILRLFRISDNRAPPVDLQPAIFPGYTAPVIRKAADGERELVPMSWGFVLSEEQDFEMWLSGSVSDAFALARSYDALLMRIVQSGFEKKDLLAA
jgi:putative SOS response-associated peptidase YedK